MTKAFVFWCIVALFVYWVMLSIEHGKAVGKGIRKTVKQFFHGEKRKRRD